MVDISVWQLLLLLNKVFIYGSIAAIIGGPLILLLITSSTPDILLYRSIHRYQLLAGITGLASLATYLLFETAAFSESGFVGLFDIDTFLILWDSPIGQSAFYRICGFIIFLVGAIVLPRIKTTYLLPLSVVIYLMMAYLLAQSFSVIGHSTSLHRSVQILLSLHALTVMIWLGSLYPLWLCCHRLSADNLYHVMYRFGWYAGFLISLLVISGAIITYQLIGSLSELVNSRYGQGFIIKLLLSASLLSIAAFHKWLLVPKLLTGNNVHNTLARSIQYEIMIAMSILLLIAAITTLTGPSHSM